MSKELPYFKFFSEQWLTGDITLENMELQGIFINVCASYWAKNCNIEIAKLKQRYGEAITTLLDRDLIKNISGIATISFLDEQWKELYERHEKNVLNGKKGAEKKWGSHSHPLATPKHIDKIRKEKKRKDKNIPTLILFLDYCKEVLKEKYLPLEFSLKAKYESWVENDWKDGNDSKIINWKTKIKNTIPFLKPMNNKTESSGTKKIAHDFTEGL